MCSKMELTKCLLALMAFFPMALSAETKIYINAVPLYSSMASCASIPISTIVRDMVAGCGDGGRLTSYNCFCQTSSSYFNSKISTAVSSACGGTAADISTALEVFQSYCAIGVTVSASVTSTSSESPGTSTASTSVPSSSSTSASSTSRSPSPSSVPSLSLPLSTSSSTSTSTSSSTSTSTSSPTPISRPLTSKTGLSTGAKAGIAIATVCVCAIFAGLIYIFFRRRRATPAGKTNFTELDSRSPNPHLGLLYNSNYPSTPDDIQTVFTNKTSVFEKSADSSTKLPHPGAGMVGFERSTDCMAELPTTEARKHTELP